MEVKTYTTSRSALDACKRGRNRSLACSLLLLAAMFLPGCGAFYPPLDTVDKVDLGSYTGRWFEIARYPNSFEPGCVGVTADYALRQDGRISVLNTCIEGDLDGEVRLIEGVARVVDQSTNAKLAVAFFPPFEGDYWILELGDDYEYAVVGEPSRTFLWILSREPVLAQDLYEEILSRLPEWGYDADRLELVLQDSDQ